MRIGISLGPAAAPAMFGDAAGRVGQLGVDSLNLIRRAARGTIQAAASAAGREVEADHFGISLATAQGGVPADVATAIGQRRPGSDLAALVPARWAAARRMIEQYIAAGISKFVVRPAEPPASLDEFLDTFTRELMPLQN